MLQYAIAREMGINMLGAPPSEWTVGETFYMAALGELYDELLQKNKRRGKKGVPPPDLSEGERVLWQRALEREYVLLDADGVPVQNEQGEAIPFTAGDKIYEVGSEDFEADWERFMASESEGMYAQRLRKLLAAQEANA